jgi:hypothetical protein
LDFIKPAKILAGLFFLFYLLLLISSGVALTTEHTNDHINCRTSIYSIYLPHMWKKLNESLIWGIIFAFTANVWAMPSVYAQELYLPAPGQMVALSPAFSPAVLKGIKLDPKNPFRFHFFVDSGDSKLKQEELKAESAKLIKYFLASLTIPEKDLWVNLSPYEKDRIVPQEFGQTEMGRDLLAQDYLLKQITASVIYPESQLGKEFWKKVYAKAQAKYGTTNIPINTFNKVWIVPEKAVVYENGGTAFVLENHLKVMLEQDYLSLQKHNNKENMSFPHASVGNPDISKTGPSIKTFEGDKDVSSLGSNIVREIVIPALTKEVNEGKNFFQLRQVFYSLILATWYKKKIKDSILNRAYFNRNKIGGVNVSAGDKNKIYQEYLKAFKKGVYNYIKEESDPVTGRILPRKYFSGGLRMIVPLETRNPQEVKSDQLAGLDKAQLTDLDVQMNVKTDAAMIKRSPEEVKRDKVVLFVLLESGKHTPKELAEKSKQQLTNVGTDLAADPQLGGHINLVKKKRRSAEQTKADRELLLKLLDEGEHTTQQLAAKVKRPMNEVENDRNLDPRIRDHKNLIYKDYRTAGEIQIHQQEILDLLNQGKHTITELAAKTGKPRWIVKEDVKKSDILRIHHNLITNERRSDKKVASDRQELKRLLDQWKYTPRELANITGRDIGIVVEDIVGTLELREHVNLIMAKRRTVAQMEADGQKLKALLDAHQHTIRQLYEKTGINTQDIASNLRRDPELGEHRNLSDKRVPPRSGEEIADDQLELARLLDKSKHTLRQLAQETGRSIYGVATDVSRSDSLCFHENLVILEYRSAREIKDDHIALRSLLDKDEYTTRGLVKNSGLDILKVRATFLLFKDLREHSNFIPSQSLIDDTSQSDDNTAPFNAAMNADEAMTANKSIPEPSSKTGGIDFNPAQMSMWVKKDGQDFKFDFNGIEIDAAQVTGVTFTIRQMTPVTNLPKLLGIYQK